MKRSEPTSSYDLAQPGDSKHLRENEINVFICTDLDRNNIGTNGKILFFILFFSFYAFLRLRQ